MKKAVIAAAAAATLWGGIALAQDDSASVNVQSGDQQTQLQTDQNGNVSGDVNSAPTSQTQQDNWRDRTVPDNNTGVGGSGPAQVYGTPSNNCDCRAAPGTGGSGSWNTSNDAQSTYQGTTGTYNQNTQRDNDNDNEATENDQYPQDQTRRDVQEGTGGSGETTVIKEENNQGPDLNGVSVLLGGGVEGYTGSLAPKVAVGPTYGATLQLRPTDILGLELEYSGAVHEIKGNVTGGANAANGADIVRNGARAMATIGLLDANVQPYILGGVGVNWYNVRGRATSYGFRDDTSGEIPLGLGFRTQVAGFTADLRGLYNIPFDQNFAPGVSTNTNSAAGATVKTQNDGRYQATLSIGANF